MLENSTTSPRANDGRTHTAAVVALPARMLVRQKKERGGGVVAAAAVDVAVAKTMGVRCGANRGKSEQRRAKSKMRYINYSARRRTACLRLPPGPPSVGPALYNNV